MLLQITYQDKATQTEIVEEDTLEKILNTLTTLSMKVDSMGNEIEKLKTNEDKLKSIATNQLTQQCAELCRSEDIKVPELEGDDGTLHRTHNVYQSTSVEVRYINLASESSILSGKVTSPMIEIVEMKNSSEPASPAVANSKKIRIAVTLGNSVAPPVSETTTTQDTVVYGDGFSLENRENVKGDAAITEIGGATPSDLKTVELGPLVYESKADCKELSPSSRWSKVISIIKHDERFKVVEQAKDPEDLSENYVEELENKEHVKALEEQKRNRVKYLEFLKSCDFIKVSSQWRKVQDRLETDERCSRLEKIDRLEIFQIRDLVSEEEEQRKLRMEELRKAVRKNHDEFRKLMEEHVAVGILDAKTNWHDYCIKFSLSFLCSIKDFAAYPAVSSNTLGLTATNLFTDVMDELEKQVK
ncbi:hypothetical protein T459_28957 [Capsicum annuum]|uniref:FF domain-containing protein n=1 Tax=Capsicum annuum TaxID=4072 RepID=A0A2G2YID1_CAPAN|nr:hypothetical protein T459_28957 [Capsicum annuum]